MSATFLKVQMIGNLGRDPETRYTPSGQPVTTFSCAANRQYDNQNGERVEEQTWVRVTTWGKLAENCANYLHKGSQVYIEGRLVPDKQGNPRIWNRQDGTPAASFEVTATEVKFLSRAGGNGSAQEEPAAEGAQDENIPF